MKHKGKIMNKLLISITLAFSLVGCVSSDSVNSNCADCYYASKNALPCPLCKNLPTISKYEVDLEKRGFRPPEGLAAPYYLHSIGCRNENCMVAKSLRLGFWREEDAVAEWNSRVEKQKKAD